MIRIRSVLTARRHTLAAASVIVALGLAVVFSHAAPAGDHMGGMGGMDEPTAQSAIVTMCLAVIGLGTAGAGVFALLLVARRRLPVPVGHDPDLGRPIAFTEVRPLAKTRAGPSLLQVYRL